MKVLITDPIAEAGVEILKQAANVETKKGLTPESLRSIIGEYDALVVRSQTRVTADIIAAGKDLKVIGRAGVGVDNIDVEAATRAGILVVNSLEGNIVSTAEHTIAMLLAMVRQIPKGDRLLHGGVWNRQLKGVEVRNKVIGIVGLGRVGSEVAQFARGLRMNVIAYDPMVSEDRASRLGVKLVSLETLLSTSDFITVHVPLDARTRGLIGPEQLKMLKPSAMIVNCARGGIIDEGALYEAVEKGLIAGAAVDVFTREPAEDNILVKSDKIVVTPHLAASTPEAEISAARDVAEQIVAVLKGYPPRSPVNAPMVSAESMSVLAPYLEVARILGRIAVQLIRGQPNSLSIRYEGEIARQNTAPLKVAVLSGLLGAITEERVSIVNADMIAESRGLRIAEEKDTTCEHYANMVVVKVTTPEQSTIVAGSSLRGRMYLTRVDDYWLEVEPSCSYILFTEHKDRPGVVGAVGTILGNADVNISQMQVSRGIERGGRAMMVLCLDGPLPDDCRRQILAVPDMHRVTTVNLA